MAKRFTETAKWRDGWFLKLPARYKLAWIYVCDECDHAGFIEIVEPLANMQIGEDIDWVEFVSYCTDKIIDLGEGKFWVKAFCDFQYGTLNPENRVHKSVLNRFEKMGLASPLKAPSEGAKDKEKDKEKDSRNKDSAADDDWIFPDGWDSIELRQALDGPDGFVAMRKRKKKPVNSKRSTSKIFKRFDNALHLFRAIEECTANEWQGLKVEYGRESGERRTVRQTFAQQRVQNTKTAIENFANG